MDKDFGKKILKYKDEILRDTAELMKIPSVVNTTNASEETPFGEESKRALNWILNRAEEMGLKTNNILNKAGHAEYGEGDEVIGVLSHVDIVPVGEGWSHNPYELVEIDGAYRGRGIVDDKGPAVIALYCLKVLQDEKVKGKYKIRTIFGAGEEINSDDIETYFKHEKMPAMAFTPDAEYGICGSEKGIMRVKFEANNGQNESIIKTLKGGTVVNSVPSKAVAVINCNEKEKEILIKNSKTYKCKFEFNDIDEGLEIISTGVASHAMEPQKGINAISYLIKLLAETFGNEKVGKFVSFINKYIGTTYNGEVFGVDLEDEVSGNLTMNLGLIDIDEKNSEAMIDIRFPVTHTKEEILEKIFNISKKEGITATDAGGLAPLYLPSDLPLMKILKSSYKNITGEDAKVYSTGGGTYARELNNKGAAFGPCFGDYSRIHDVGENIKVEDFWLHAQINLQAMYELLISE